MTPDLSFTHRFVPASAGDSQVTLLMLHGTGGSEEDLIPLAQTLQPGAAILSPRGNVLERGMPRFFRRISEGVFDIPDLISRTHELAGFIEETRQKYQFAGELVCVGYSNGANIAASLMLLHPKAVSAAVLFRVMVPFIPEDNPNLLGARVLVAAGRHDPIVPPSNTLKLAELLEAAGAEVSLHWHDGGHALGADDIEAARLWLAKT